MACPQSRSLGQHTGLQWMPGAAGAQKAPALKTAAHQGQNRVWRQSTRSIQNHTVSLLWHLTRPMEKNKTYLSTGLVSVSSPGTRAPWRQGRFLFAHCCLENSGCLNNLCRRSKEKKPFSLQLKRRCSQVLGPVCLQHLTTVVICNCGSTRGSPGELLKPRCSRCTPDQLKQSLGVGPRHS